MWLMTKYGFFSMVCAKANGGKGPGIDTDKMMFRARTRQQIVNFCRFAGLDESSIRESEKADYRFRVIVPRPSAIKIVTELATDVDYGNFKSEVQRAGYCEGSYLSMLHEVWEIGYSIQAAFLRGYSGVKEMFGMSASDEPKRGMLVEDETVVAGTDENGATHITPKTADGRADESIIPTDSREE